MSQDKVYVGSVSRLGTFQQRRKIKYASAFLKDEEQLSNVKRQVIQQQCFKIGSFSAM